MTIVALFILFVLFASFSAVLYFQKRRVERAFELAKAQAVEDRARIDAEIARMSRDAAAEVERFRAEYERKTKVIEGEVDRAKDHYQDQVAKVVDELHGELAKARSDVERLADLQGLTELEGDVRKVLEQALTDAATLKAEADRLHQAAKGAEMEARKQGKERADKLKAEAEALLTQATKDAGQLLARAEAKAVQIGGDAYLALREKEQLERAVVAIHNVIEGYGDRYIIPTHSLLDDLASDFGHTAAGESLRAAREQSRRMVELGEAAACDYVEVNRRETAIRFVTDAFNGRVDAILSRVKHDNFGTLEQEIRDTFSLVNLNGEAFRNARILPLYCDARVAELRWAVIVQELRMKEREEQRRIQEQIREEEKARREYERARQEALKEEEIIRKAMEKAQLEAQTATAEERKKLEAKLEDLNRRLVEAEAKNQRAISMAEQTRSGHVYIISNVGSFGEEVVKIGMTRRLLPDERIKELSDASVPFQFDVHAMIQSDDAPKLERELHEAFEELRVNKVNYRKEFFRVPVKALREFVAERNLQASFTMTAEAREYRETQAFERMTPEERVNYAAKQQLIGDGGE